MAVAWTTCPHCGTRLKGRNLARHLRSCRVTRTAPVVRREEERRRGPPAVPRSEGARSAGGHECSWCNPPLQEFYRKVGITDVADCGCCRISLPVGVPPQLLFLMVDQREAWTAFASLVVGALGEQHFQLGTRNMVINDLGTLGKLVSEFVLLKCDRCGQPVCQACRDQHGTAVVCATCAHPPPPAGPPGAGVETAALARHEAKCAGPQPAAQRSAKAKPASAAKTAPPAKTEPYCQQCGAPRASKYSFSGCDFWFCSDTCRSLFGNQLFQLSRGDMLTRGSRMATFGGRPAGTIAAYCYRCGTRHELPAVQRAVHEAVCRRCGGKLLP